MKIGFSKKEQGVFQKERLEAIILGLNERGAEVIRDVDYSDMVIVNNAVFVHGKKLEDLSAYFWHDSVQPALWNADNYYLNALEVLEKTCPVINTAASTRIVNDKFQAHGVLRSAGLPVSESALINATDSEGLAVAFEQLGSSVLMKPRFGGWGSGIVKIDSVDDLRAVAEYAGSMHPGTPQQVFLEKYYENDVNSWISIVVMNNEVLFGYRKGGDLIHDWKVYDPTKKDGRGEQSEYIQPSDELRGIALAAAKAIGKDIIGFDCILTDNGYVIVDENGRPGLYQHCIDEAGIDLNEKVIDMILSKVQK